MRDEFDREFDRRMKQALAGGLPEAAASDEEEKNRQLLAAVREKREKRKAALHRQLLSAAAVVCLCLLLGGLYAGGVFQPEETQAGRNPQSSVTEENGSIVIGGDGNGNEGTWTATFTSYEDVPEAYREKMIWFEDVPEGYEIEEIKIEIVKGIQKYIINYISVNCGEIRIIEADIADDEDYLWILNQYEHKAEINNVDVYSKKENGRFQAGFLLNEKIIQITAEISAEKEIEAMVASIRTAWNRM